MNQSSPTTLLCESCGYTISGLPTTANCSECGRPVASSLPESRPGSPWQQRPGIRSLLKTDYLVLRHPLSLFSSIRIHPRRAPLLLAIHLLIAAVFLVAPFTGTLIDDPIRSARSGRSADVLLTALIVVPLQVLAVAALLLVLTAIEWAGIQFYTNRKGGRLTPAAATQICAHASVGWVATAAALHLGLVVWLNVSYFGLSTRISSSPAVANLAPFVVVGALAFAGLLVFELLVYAGVRRNRFSNPLPDPPPADHAPAVA